MAARGSGIAGIMAVLCLTCALACAPSRLPVGTPPVPAPAPPETPSAAPPAPQVEPPVAAPQSLAAVPWAELGEVRDDLAFAGLAAACRESVAFYRRQPPGASFVFGETARTATEMASSLEALLPALEDAALGPVEKTARVTAAFDLYRSTGSDGNGRVLFTGYYEPVLRGSDHPGPRFRYPIYRRPPDLVEGNPSSAAPGEPPLRFGRVVEGKVVPYFTREEIDGKAALAGKGLELLWLDDPLDRFFLQVQGSGRVVLEDGRAVRVLYAGKNGHPYSSLGRWLVAQGKMRAGEVSLESIRAYFEAHPEEREAALAVNASYTFFRLGEGGPFGNTGAALTPRRSIATDAALFPGGALCLIRTDKPLFGEEGEVKAFEPFDRFVLNQDTGGAITGPGRVDLFFGPGAEAARDAGQMQQVGTLYFLVPRK